MHRCVTVTRRPFAKQAEQNSNNNSSKLLEMPILMSADGLLLIAYCQPKSPGDLPA